MLSFSVIEAVRMNKNFVKRLSTDNEGREQMFIKNREARKYDTLGDDDDGTGTERELRHEYDRTLIGAGGEPSHHGSIINDSHGIGVPQPSESQYLKRRAAFEQIDGHATIMSGEIGSGHNTRRFSGEINY